MGLLATAGEYTFLNSSVMTSIDSAISNLSTDVGTFFSNNMVAILAIIGGFVAVGLIWWIISFFTRSRKKG